jgi:hypothetical protein
MDVKMKWIIRAVTLAILVGAIYPGWRMMHPSSPGYLEPARANQATPMDTVNAMFVMMKAGPGADNSNSIERFNPFDDAHLLTGKDMSIEEQQFAELFWDHLCSGVIYSVLSDHMEKAPRMMDHTETGDSAKVTFSVSVDAENAGDPVDEICTFDLKKRGANWHISEMTSPRSPGGVYQAFKVRMGTAP